MTTIIRSLDDLKACATNKGDRYSLPAGVYQIEGVTIDLGALRLEGGNTLVESATARATDANIAQRVRSLPSHPAGAIDHFTLTGPGLSAEALARLCRNALRRGSY